MHTRNTVTANQTLDSETKIFPLTHYETVLYHKNQTKQTQILTAHRAAKLYDIKLNIDIKYRFRDNN